MMDKTHSLLIILGATVCSALAGTGSAGAQSAFSEANQPDGAVSAKNQTSEGMTKPDSASARAASTSSASAGSASSASAGSASFASAASASTASGGKVSTASGGSASSAPAAGVPEANSDAADKRDNISAPAQTFDAIKPDAVKPENTAAPVGSQVNNAQADEAPALPGAGAALQVEPAATGDAGSTACIFEKLVVGLSGAPINDSTRNLLQGVKSIRRKQDSVELTKEDNSVTVLGSDTEFGAKVVRDFGEVKEKLQSKLGDKIGNLADDFIGLSAAGSHFTVERLSPDDQVIDLTQLPADLKLPVKRVRLGNVKFNIAESKGRCVLKDIEGIEVVPTSPLVVTIEVKEFARYKNADGDDVLTVGVKSPIPRPFRMLFGFKELMNFSFTLKHKPVQNIGQVPDGAKPNRTEETDSSKP